jgi:PA14 domain
MDGTLTPPQTGYYRFAAVQSGHVTLVVNGKTLLTGESENDLGKHSARLASRCAP